jgi:hypothetical protein
MFVVVFAGDLIKLYINLYLISSFPDKSKFCYWQNKINSDTDKAN